MNALDSTLLAPSLGALAADGPIVPVILSGGSGTRLWPVSRESFPKQFFKYCPANSFTFPPLASRTPIAILYVSWKSLPLMT